MPYGKSTVGGVPEQSGHLKVISVGRHNSRPMCFCRCVCGVEKWVREDRIRSGRATSCGCRRREKITTHGMSHGEKKNPIYKVWAAMIARCDCRTHKQYSEYGGRGITVCDRWRGRDGVLNFAADMGDRPEGHSIDRIDNDGGYEPSNCRWANRSEQQRNKRSNRLVTFKGVTKCVAEWAEELKIPWHAIGGRLNAGWSDERAISTPYKPKPRRR